MRELVASVPCAEYEPKAVETAVREAVSLAGYEIPRGLSVLIKPNILAQNRPEQHSITHFTVVEAVCRLFLDNGCRVTIGESIAFWQKGLTRRAFETSRIGEVARGLGVKLAAFDEAELVQVSGNLEGMPDLYVPRVALEADAVVSACKLKTHGGLRLSGAVKNLFGVLPGGYKQLLHMRTENDFRLSDVFLDLVKLLHPALSVMDAVVGLDGGPSAAGKPRQVGVILAAKSPCALDTAASRIIGYDLNAIPYLSRATERGMLDLATVETVGNPPRVPFRRLVKGAVPLHEKRDGFMVRETSVQPEIRHSRCDACGRCIKSCAPGAIVDGEAGKPVILEDNCIRCYVCASVCPREAIVFRRSIVNRLVGLGRAVIGI